MPNDEPPILRQQPFISKPMTVDPAWIDYNGHMNMAYYTVLFDRCADEAFNQIGIGIDYVKTRQLSFFTAEIHISYMRELHAGDEVTVSLQLIDHDDKRMHVYLEVRHADGWIAATGEALFVHVDLTGPRAVACPPDIAASIEAFACSQASLPRPERVGRSIGIRKKHQSE